MSTDLAFALHDVNARLGSFALRDVSFELPAGYVMGFIGANGAGKTTTIRCLLGMQQIQSGRIELLGRPVPARSSCARTSGWCSTTPTSSATGG